MYIYGQFGMRNVERFDYKPRFYPNPQSDEVYWVPPGWTHHSGENVQDIGVNVAYAQHPWKSHTGGVRVDLNFWVFTKMEFATFVAVAYGKYYNNNNNKPNIPMGISRAIGQCLGVQVGMEDDTDYNKDPDLVYRH